MQDRARIATDSGGALGFVGSYDWGDDKYSIFGEGSVMTRLADFGDSYALRRPLAPHQMVIMASADIGSNRGNPYVYG